MSIDSKSKHYDAGGIEVIDVLKAKLTPEQFEGYLLGNVIKYSLRYNFKDQKADDARKCEVYSKELLKHQVGGFRDYPAQALKEELEKLDKASKVDIDNFITYGEGRF